MKMGRRYEKKWVEACLGKERSICLFMAFEELSYAGGPDCKSLGGKLD